MANNPPPCVGQFVSRELTKDPHICYIAEVNGSRTGGNGTIQYEVKVENFVGTKSEYILITSGDMYNHETQPWQCGACECFATCVCPCATREE